MLSSRALALLRKSAPLAKYLKSPSTPILKQSRQSSSGGATGWYYRRDVKIDRYEVIWADCIGGFMWCWVLYHVYHDYHHLIGRLDYPEPSEWTDAELGIPPDDQVYEDFDPERCIVPLGFYDKK